MSARAFGLALSGSPEIPGTGAPDDDDPPGPPLVVSLATRRALTGDWPAGARSVARLRTPGGRVVGRTLHHPGRGFLMRAQGHGVFTLDEEATRLRCAPVRSSAWPWERYAVAQVLPFAALLRGLEVLHAAAVAIGDGAVAVTAPSLGGKSTLLGALLLRGARLVADDVVAIAAGDGPLRVHPGPGLLSLRPAGLELLGGSSAAQRLGPPARTIPDSLWLDVGRETRVLELRSFWILRRHPGAREIRVERERPVDPRALLGSTFNAAWTEPRRLLRQLDVCATLARTVPVFHLHAPMDASPDALARALESAA